MKKRKKKRVTRNDLDKMSFEKREKIRKKLKQEAVYTRSFKTPQSFGAASNVIHLTLEEYLARGGNTSILEEIKNETRSE